MPINTYLYENRMFTNKMKCSIFGRERPGKERVALKKLNLS
jgi:hypothetical protein